jgi:hypothetical protein
LEVDIRVRVGVLVLVLVLVRGWGWGSRDAPKKTLGATLKERLEEKDSDKNVQIKPLRVSCSSRHVRLDVCLVAAVAAPRSGPR